MPDRPWIPWKRWWTPLGGPIHLEQTGGFLSDPVSEFGHLYSLNVFPLDDLLQRHCLILCGEPGIGKTRELDELETRLTTVANAPQVLRVNFRSCLDGADFRKKVFESHSWAAWLQSSNSLLLIVDGVDEGLWLAPSFLEWLIDKLRTDVPLDRLSVIFACRTLEWPQALGAQLAALWGEPKEQEGPAPGGFQFELCPLTRSAVVQAATAHSILPNDFLRAVHERQVYGLAARPLTLFMLLDEFRDRGGNLTRTHRQLYLDFCKRLCEEPDALRAQRLRRRKVAWLDYRPSQKQVVAGRIAAMMFLTAKSSVITGTGLDRASTDLTISDITVGNENDGAGNFAVTEDLVEATLATGLFNSKGRSRFGFEHQTFAECLAAQYLATINFAPLRTLLLRRDEAGEYVVPQLAELASWLAGERDDIFDLLLATQPEILLRTDLSHLGDARKEQVVDALLRKAAKAEFFEKHDERRPFYAALGHPRLANQLRPVILDRRKNNVVRWLAIDIASACKCRELLSAILAILRRGKDRVALQAGYALDDLVDNETAPLLIPIADSSFVPEPPRSVRVTALRALVSTIWSVADALPMAVKIVRSADFLDWYLADRARPNDVKEGLRVIATCDRIFDSLFRLRRLAMRLLELAADQLEDTAILDLVATILVKALREYQIDAWANAGTFGKLLEADREKRRLVICALHRRMTGGNADRWQLATLCLSEDVPWLLDRAVTSRGAERRANLELARALLRPDFLLPHWDEIIDRLRNEKALKPIKQQFDAWRLNGAQAKAARAAHIQREERRARHRQELARQKPPERSERIKTVLKFRPENVWIGLREALFIDDAREWASGGGSHDIEHSPGWIAATDGEREQFREIARQFLLNHRGEFICQPNQGTYGADAAFAAAWLLRDELTQPGKLQDAFANKCVVAVVWHFAADDAEAELAALIYSLNPVRCREVYVEKMEFDAACDSGLTLAARPFLTCWDSELTNVTARFLLAKVRLPETIRSVLTELARVDAAAIPTIWRSLVRRAAKQGKRGIARAAAASELMIELFAEECWDELFPFLSANRDITRSALLRSSPVGLGYGLKPTQRLTEDHLASFYLLLYDIFSPSDREEQWGDSGEPRTVTSRHNAARFRDSLVERLIARGSPVACRAMRRVVNGVSREHRLWMKKRWLDCIELVRRKAWTPIEPEQLLEIARRRNAFWVENEDDLMLVISESLDELQRSIGNSPTGDVLDFWDYKRRGGLLSEQRPKAEVDVARKIYAWLQQRLASRHGAIIQREVTIQWDQRRTDIEVIVTRHTSRGALPIGVVLEVKHAWNAGVCVDARRQLRDRYLKRTGKTRGIYLVTWFESDLWRPRRRVLKARTVAGARDEIANICRRATKLPIIIAPYVLDCSFPT